MRNLPPAQFQPHVWVIVGLTGQPPKVRGQGELLGLGAELHRAFPSFPLVRNNKPWPTGLPQLKRAFPAKEPRSFRSGSKGRSHAGSFPTQLCAGFHSSAISPWAAAGVQEQEGRNGDILCTEQGPAGCSTWARNWTAFEGVMWYKAHPSQQSRHF